MVSSEMHVFLLTGQSNMSGRGRLDEVAPIVDERLLMFRDGHWQQAQEPLHRDNPAIAGVGLAMSFAAQLLEWNMCDRVGLVPCAWGATSLSQWQPGEELYRMAVTTTRAALAPPGAVLNGILWHQGENDTVERRNAESYGKRLTAVVDGMRADLSAPSTPFITGELGQFLAANEVRQYYALLNEQLHRLVETVPHYAVASSEGLADDGYQLHFGSQALRTFGIRYAQEYARLLCSPRVVPSPRACSCD
ncbi:MAG: sialate O-acetylesterase [Chitinivibrionales bacterium]|nr:sialate O-acetylesterase [Chitinivibrionales bacterium]